MVTSFGICFSKTSMTFYISTVILKTSRVQKPFHVNELITSIHTHILLSLKYFKHVSSGNVNIGCMNLLFFCRNFLQCLVRFKYKLELPVTFKIIVSCATMPREPSRFSAQLVPRISQSADFFRGRIDYMRFVRIRET